MDDEELAYRARALLRVARIQSQVDRDLVDYVFPRRVDNISMLELFGPCQPELFD